MAELSKLLAFMFKEDKEDILAQYNRMLDEADDEQALLESFGSPTKLAVTISRTYKRSERKLAVEADSKADFAETKPAEAEHIIVTPVKKEKPVEKPAEVNTGLSYADIIEEIRREKAEEEGVEYKPMFFNEPEEAPAAETSESETAGETAPEATPEEVTPAETDAGESGETAAEDAEKTEDSEETEDSEKTAGTTETAAEESEPSAEEETVAEQPDEAENVEPAPVSAETEEEPETADADENIAPELIFEELENAQLAEETVRYKTNAALLILYLIFAIPIGAVLLVLALAVTLVLFGCGAAVIAAGVEAISFAFAKLVIFADIMLCAGSVLIAFAVALILLWLGVLMLVRGLKGIVSGIVSLGRKFCVREVPVNE